VNPFLSKELAGEHIRDLRDEAGRAGRGRTKKSAEDSDWLAGITVRLFAERDIDSIRRLAALDEKPVPIGGVLVAEMAGELVAALPLAGGEALADPFKPTAQVVDLLRLRARQLRTASAPRRSIRPVWAHRHTPARKLA
jgi:hypothetical protein